MDILWHCLVEDPECYDDALHWFLNQVRSKDQHAMGMETYKHLFLEKVSKNCSLFPWVSSIPAGFSSYFKDVWVNEG